VQAVDADLPVFNVREVDEIVTETLGRPRFSMTVLALFAAGAVVLAAIGVFGVLSVWVGQQVRDLGIRLALGAPRWKVLRMVVGRGMVPVLVGVMIGLGLSALLTRFLGSQLFGVSATDPVIFAGVPVVLVLVGLLAGFLPASRATRVDPMTVLRGE
jgi:ABC-type antimicrobial peptide transport system permease subunit